MADNKFDLAVAKLAEAKRRKRLFGNTLDYKIGQKGAQKALRQRASEVGVSFVNLWSWWVAYQSRGFDALLPAWTELAEKSQKIASQRYNLLGDLIYLDVITEAHINQLAARLPKIERHSKNVKKTRNPNLENEDKKHPAFDRAHVLVKRWVNGGLWGLAPESNPYRAKNPKRPNADPGVLTDQEEKQIYEKIDSVKDLADREKGSVTREEIAARAEQLGVSPRTVYYRIAKVRAHKLKSFTRRARGDTGKSHGISSKMVQKIEDLRLANKDWKARAVYEEACKYAERTGEAPPSLGQVYRIIERIPEPLKLFADGRRSEFSNKYRITKRLNLEDKLILQADFTPIPMLLKASEGEKNANKSGDVTAYLVEIIEANSRYVFPPIFVTKTPSQLEVAASIRNAMLVIGFFNELWVDRGKQYVSKRIERISKKKNFKLFKCPPRYPQLKGRIERYFRTVETRCWSKLEGYTGPDLTRRNPTAKAKYTVEDLIKIYEEFRSKYNNVEEHSETGQIPAEALQNRPTYFPDMTSEDRAELDLLLKIEENAKILQQGIRYKKHWYYHSDLKDNVGAKVTLFIEPGDGVPQEVRVYLDDQVLCAAVNTTSDEGKILLNEIGNDQRAQTAYYRKRIKEAREREKQDQINSEVINDTHPKGESSEATKLVLGDTIPRKPTKPESQRKIKRFSDIL